MKISAPKKHGKTRTSASKSPLDARDNIQAALPPSHADAIESEGERKLEHASVSAKIEWASHGPGWIAEFRFRFRGGSYQACALPLSVHSKKFENATLAIADAATRLLNSARVAVSTDQLGAAQAKAMSAISEWAQSLIDAGAAQTSGALAGKRFLDVFGGIGGFHLALASHGAQCAGAIEIDRRARQTYRANHCGGYPFPEDARLAKGKSFGAVDIVCGGFPCQSFSKAGHGTGLGDAAKGALFFELARLIGEIRPAVAILENVPALANHDNGATYQTIEDALTRLGYSLSSRVLDAGDFGLPQTRERLFLVCVRDGAALDRSLPFIFPKGADASKVVADILERKSAARPIESAMQALKPAPSARSNKIETIGLIDGKDHQGYRVASVLGKGYALCASSGGVGGRTGLYLVNGKPRSLTPREAARMQGFPDDFSLRAAPAALLRQLGNSVAVPVVSAIAGSLGNIRFG